MERRDNEEHSKKSMRAEEITIFLYEERDRGMKMRWYAGRGRHFYRPMGHYHARLEDGTQIEVHPDTYDAQFNAYLEQKGIKRTTWFEIFQRAEREWEAYCRVMDAFAENLQQGQTFRGEGVFIERERSAVYTGAKQGEVGTFTSQSPVADHAE